MSQQSHQVKRTAPSLNEVSGSSMPECMESSSRGLKPKPLAVQLHGPQRANPGPGCRVSSEEQQSSPAFDVLEESLPQLMREWHLSVFASLAM